jgi:hypothetical protein
MKYVFLIIEMLMLSISSVFAQSFCEETILKQNWNLSDYVLIGKVISIDPAPRTWSGIVWVPQKVKYKLIKNLKGEIVEKKINVTHYVVKNTLTADKEFPQLSPSLFSKGNLIILFLSKTTENENEARINYKSEDSNCGALIATESLTNLITSNFK